MVLTTRTYTAEDLWRMPGDEPWELWDGELRTVPGSGEAATRVALRIGARLLAYEDRTGLGVATGSDGSYVLFPNERTVVVPDAAFVRHDRLPPARSTTRYLPVPPDLAVEVQSPTDEPADMAAKRALYARAGVPLLWWVDPAARTVTVHRPGHAPVVLGETDVLAGEDVLPGLRIPVSEVFA